ncbi:MAG: hypothetical protein KF752_13265 [Pirellulaceae bacterium]|nr:hypothetical protein [Pirellulaceae bacterium]
MSASLIFHEHLQDMKLARPRAGIRTYAIRTRAVSLRSCTLCLAAVACLSSTLFAEDPPTTAPAVEASRPQYRTNSGKEISMVVEGLLHPTGVALQPETGLVWVADSGNGQIVRIVDGKSEPMITEFVRREQPAGIAGLGGPLSIAFLSKNTLVVSCGAHGESASTLKVFTLPDPIEPLKAEAAKTTLTLPQDNQSDGSGDFFSLAITANAVFAATAGDTAQTWIARASRNGDELSEFDRFADATNALGVGNSGGATVSPHGYLVLGQMFQLGTEKDSLIAFFDTATKEALLKLDSGLMDISAVAYSARRQMYVLDAAWSQPDAGGLYRIVADATVTSGMKAIKLADLLHPICMAFDGEGGLYVTLRDAADHSGGGRLVKIPADENL